MMAWRWRVPWAAAVAGWLLTAQLLGVDGSAGDEGLSAECLSGLENATCSFVQHESGFHASQSNGMIVKLKQDECLQDGKTQTCSVSHECTTCSSYNCVFCSEDERVDIYTEPLSNKFLFLVASLTIGAAISTMLEAIPRNLFHPPFTVVMFVLGMIMGWLADRNLLGCALSDSVNAWKHQDPHSILYALLPPLLFESAFNVNYHVFTKVVRSSALLASTGVFTSTFLTGCVGMWLFGSHFDRIQYENPACLQFGMGEPDLYVGEVPPLTDGLGARDALGACIPADAGIHRRLAGGGGGEPGGCYDCTMDGWWAAMMFGAIVSATDPVAVVAVLQTLGAQPKLSHMIEGESLLNDGTAVVIFLVFKGLMLHNIQEFGTSTTILKMVGLVLRLAGGGVLLGIVFSYAVYAWLRASRNMTANIEISIMVLSVYLVFYLSEHVFGASGVLATVVYGLSLAKRKHLAMTVPTAEQNEVVWQEIGYVANSFTFALAGVILIRILTHSGDTRFDRAEQFGTAVALYFILALIRLFAIFIHYHAMRACTKGGYKVQVKEAIFMTYSGLRGAVSLCVALFVDHMDGVPQLVKDVIIFHTCLCVFFTVFVNGITAGWVYKKLRLGVQGGVRGEVDAGSVKILVKNMEQYVDGMREHWFHGEHNLPEKGYDLVKAMLNLELQEDKHKDGHHLPPISDTGELTIAEVNVNKLWKDEMKYARRKWRTDPLRRCTHKSHKLQKDDGQKHDGLSDEKIRDKQRVCYNPDPHGGEESSFNSGLEPQAKHAHGGERGLEKASSKAKEKSPYHLQLDDHEGDHDIQQDLYSIYLTAIRAHYEEMREENELTATTCDYLCRAIASGSDYLKSIQMGMAIDHPDHLDVIHVAHESLKEHIHSFGLSGECNPHHLRFSCLCCPFLATFWSQPPIP